MSAWIHVVEPEHAGLVIRASIVLGLAFLLDWLLRRRPAATRHLIWLSALCSLLALPLLSSTLPGWHAAILPSIRRSLPQLAEWTRSSEPAFTAVGDALVSPTRAESPSSLPRWIGAVDWRSVTWVAWTLGAAFITWQTGASLFAVHRLARTSRPVAAGRCRAVFRDCLSLTGLVSRNITLRVAGSGIRTPVTWGLLRPTILLPAEAENWSVNRVRMVFLHELAHIARRDWAGLLLSRAVCALFWFHPLVWIAARRLRFESERAADDRVVAGGVTPAAYSKELLTLVQNPRETRIETRENPRTMSPSIRTLDPDCTLLAVLPMAQPQTLEQRIHSLLDQTRDRAGVSRVHVLAAIVAAASAILPLASIRLDAAENEVRTPAGEHMELGTPGAAVKAFIGAINRGDLKSAALCVIGGRPETITAELTGLIATSKPRITGDIAGAATQGHEATVLFGPGKVEAAAGSPGKADDQTKLETFGTLVLKLRQEGANWKISPTATDAAGSAGIVGTLAGELAVAPGQPSPGRAKAAASVNFNHLRQLALAAHMYASAHDGKFDFPGGDVKKALLPYLEENEQLFANSSQVGKKIDFAFNAKLLNQPLTHVTSPATTVFFYAPGGAQEELDFSNQGKGAVAFVDGHVESVGREQAAQLRWKP